MMSDHGHYETVGDVQEWVWDKGHEPRPTVPEGEFDPRDPAEPKSAPKAEKPKGK